MKTQGKKSKAIRAAERIVRGWEDERNRVLSDERASPHYWNGDAWGSISGCRDAEEWKRRQMEAWVADCIRTTR